MSDQHLGYSVLPFLQHELISSSKPLIVSHEGSDLVEQLHESCVQIDVFWPSVLHLAICCTVWTLQPFTFVG